MIIDGEKERVTICLEIKDGEEIDNENIYVIDRLLCADRC